ncbi:uncharacterized protein LOC111368259 [Olea europaea var. sylvestris]|uniref:uncharacterized protein LOC111368259 n=1 Tax=Olea europaea var. sylvestris TaxID=158386 RepID=UPI000C1D1168|nr:uncharacterized protein LOC111368259 [Olea europaea var. sylvestris]
MSKSPIPSCFRPATTKTITHHRSTTAAPPPTHNPNLTTCLYNTGLGLFALTWSRNLFSRSLHLHFLLDNCSSDNDKDFSFPSLSTSSSFHLLIKPFIFWRKQGSKRLDINTKSVKNAYVFWDLSRAKYGAGPEPQTGFYIAIVVDGEMILLVGDSAREAYAKTKARNPKRNQKMVVRREHVYGNKLYATKANFGGKERNISVDCRIGNDSRLYISVDNKRVLQIKHLKWKFRGNERIEVEGVNVLVSWDVYNWLFEEDREHGYALFTFRFEDDEDFNNNNMGNVIWSQQSFGFGFETKKMKKGLLRSAGSSSSSSLSSVSSSCSSVMEWASKEENELKVPSGFSLLIYAWKS